MGTTLDKKIGQMLIIRLHGKIINEDLKTLIKEYNIGGFLLSSKNYDTYEEMLNIINELKSINSKYNDIPLFISIDQEGGRVNRLPKEFKNVYSAKKLSVKKEYIKKANNLIGDALNAVGVNMNFAPVLDIQRFDDSHAIGNRCYGTDSETVSENSLIALNCYKEKNIVASAKHFPGHGLVKRDSHFLLPITFKNIKKEEDILPFKHAIKNGCDAIMISHIMVSKMDKKYPCSLSKKIIKNYLIDELNFDGLIITDDIRMKAVNLLYGYKKSAFKAIEAGNNLIMIGANYSAIRECIKYIKKKITDEIMQDIDLSYEKIIKIKEKYKISDEQKELINLDEFNNEIIKLNDMVKESLNIK